MKKTYEKTFCDCCGKEFNPNRSEFQPCSENKYKRAEIRFLVPRLVMNDNVFDNYTRYDTIEINDICDAFLSDYADARPMSDFKSKSGVNFTEQNEDCFDYFDKYIFELKDSKFTLRNIKIV